MIKKALPTVLFLLFGTVVLIISILRSASLRHSLNFSPPPPSKAVKEEVEVNYFFANPGSVLPDNPFWGLKVLRDKLWLFLTVGTSQKAELNLLFADKRLGAAKALIGSGKYELGLETILKSQKYFAEAERLEILTREKGQNTNELLELLLRASLAHRQVLKNLESALPEELAPRLTVVEDYFFGFCNRSSSYLKEKNIDLPPDLSCEY